MPVDLIVPEAAATGGGRRDARLGVHGRRAARRAPGLEAALVDNARQTITALDSADQRSVDANVAGPAALLVAKADKIHDRIERGRSDRVLDKDAGTSCASCKSRRSGGRQSQARSTPDGPASTAALAYFEGSFGRRGRPGIEMATRAMRLAIPAARVEGTCTAYTAALLEAAR